MNYKYTTEVQKTFSETLLALKNSLEKQGFGILHEIDVQKTLQSKLSITYDNYVILGACNPKIAYTLLKEQKDIGLFLPCNAIVYEQDGVVTVAMASAIATLSLAENIEVSIIAKEVEEKIKNVIININ